MPKLPYDVNDQSAGFDEYTASFESQQAAGDVSTADEADLGQYTPQASFGSEHYPSSQQQSSFSEFLTPQPQRGSSEYSIPQPPSTFDDFSSPQPPPSFDSFSTPVRGNQTGASNSGTPGTAASRDSYTEKAKLEPRELFLARRSDHTNRKAAEYVTVSSGTERLLPQTKISSEAKIDGSECWEILCELSQLFNSSMPNEHSFGAVMARYALSERPTEFLVCVSLAISCPVFSTVYPDLALARLFSKECQPAWQSD